jgi:hypothetical protein
MTTTAATTTDRATGHRRPARESTGQKTTSRMVAIAAAPAPIPLGMEGCRRGGSAGIVPAARQVACRVGSRNGAASAPLPAAPSHAQTSRGWVPGVPSPSHQRKHPRTLPVLSGRCSPSCAPDMRPDAHGPPGVLAPADAPSGHPPPPVSRRCTDTAGREPLTCGNTSRRTSGAHHARSPTRGTSPAVTCDVTGWVTGCARVVECARSRTIADRGAGTPTPSQ